MKDSYIQIGPVSEYVLLNSTMMPTSNWQSWSVPVSDSFFTYDNNYKFKFQELEARALFDPYVDYLYVNGLEFTNIITHSLKAMYEDKIACTDT